MNYEQLKGIPVSEYEYPGEANAFALLKKIPVLDQLAAGYLKFCVQAQALPQVQGDCFRVTKETSPEVFRIYQKALKRLDMDQEYPLYAKAEYEYNATAYGGAAPFVEINSSVLKNMSEEELLFILGHELGHIKSGHSIYATMAAHFQTLIRLVPLPGIDLASTGIYYALIHWSRMQEYTADRAGVLAAGSIEPAQKALARFMGVEDNLPDIRFTIGDLLKQNASFEEENKDLFGKLLSAEMIAEFHHPWTVNRIQELEAWKESGAYEELLRKYAI